MPISYLVLFECLLHLLCVTETMSITMQQKSNNAKFSTDSNGIMPSWHGALLEGLLTDDAPEVNSSIANTRTILVFNGENPNNVLILSLSVVLELLVLWPHLR